MSSSSRVIKKGQYLFKAGEKIQSVLVIQAGQVNLCLQKNNKVLDIMTVSNGFVFGDLVVLGTNVYLYSALAQQEVKITEIPLDVFKAQYEAMNPISKSFIKTMADRLKWAMAEIKNNKQEKSGVPCSDESIPRVFGSIYHVLNHKGLKEGDRAKIDWHTLRNYSQRIFGESLKRVEQITQLLVKLKQAEYIMGKDPNNLDADAQIEIQGFEIYNLSALESFFEFYQYYYYKGGKSELLKFDESCYNTLRLLLLSFASVQPDRFGIVSKNLNDVIENCKEYGMNLGNGHFTALEAKGLFCKRKNNANGQVDLQFDIKEFRTQNDIWSLIKEIDKLNEKGFVDSTEIDDGPKKKLITNAGVGESECDQCHSIISIESKFCSECGAKVSSIQTIATERKTA